MVSTKKPLKSKPAKKSTRGLSYTSVEFKNPDQKGQRMLVSVHGWGGGPHTAHGFDSSIPARFTVEVVHRMRGDPTPYLVFTEDMHARISQMHEAPRNVMDALFKKGAAFCKKHGFVKADKTQTTSAKHQARFFSGRGHRKVGESW